MINKNKQLLLRFGSFYSSCDQRWFVFGWVVCFFTITTILQCNIPYPVDYDTAYHFAVGQLIKKYGILHSFPWTSFSLQFDHYADKEFLFHIIFIPFSSFGLINASRIVGILTGTFVLTALYFVLRQQRVINSGVWALVPLTIGIFVYRFLMVRPHLLSIALALLMLWSYLYGKQFMLLIVAILYPLSYVAFWQIPLILVLAAESARFFSLEQFRYKLPFIVVSGIAIGVVLHPNSINMLNINWLHMYDILFQSAWAGKTKIQLGGEFSPASVMEWLLSLSINVVFVITALVISWKGRRVSSSPLAFTIVALIFGILTVKSMRFSEYFVPFSVAAIAMACNKFNSRVIAPIILMSTFSIGSSFALPAYYSAIVSLDNRDSYIDQDETELLLKNVPIGSQVFTCSWEYTGSLMVALPDRYFMVAADPTLFYKKDPVLYDIWRMMPFCSSLNAAGVIRKNFNSRYVICKNSDQHDDFFASLKADHRVVMSSTSRWILFDLGVID